MRVTGPFVGEGPGAVGTGVWSLAGVPSLVPQHVGALHEAHRAVGAGVARPLVDLDVFTERVTFLEFWELC